MIRKNLCRVAILLLAGLAADAQPFRVATVGDSFGDALYDAMRARPDLMKRSDVGLARWSRPVVGLTRTRLFRLPGMAPRFARSGHGGPLLRGDWNQRYADIPAAPKQWIRYGSPPWKEAYAGRTLAMARALADGRCGQVLWVLQPGFEKRDALACHRELINEVQREMVRLNRTRVLEIVTSESDYGRDRTHLNRACLLQLGPALYHLVDSARQIVHGGCLRCHGNVAVSPPAAEILPLRWPREKTAAPLWAPEHTGIACRVAIGKPAVRPSAARRAVRPLPRR